MSEKRISDARSKNSGPQKQESASPFVVGRPLRADERIFGREETFRFIGGELKRFSSVNIIGERRMGKTSLLNHLLAHQSEYLLSRSESSPFVMIRIDLQGGISNAQRFYGTAMREMLNEISHGRATRKRNYTRLMERLNTKPEADIDEFSNLLRQFHDSDECGGRPILVVDEFEILLEHPTDGGFPYLEVRSFPHFSIYNLQSWAEQKILSAY
jgi:hypothetical protein